MKTRIIILTLATALIVSGLGLFLPQKKAEAAIGPDPGSSPRAKNRYEELSRKREGFYRAAAYIFWNSRDFKDEGYPDCLPDIPVGKVGKDAVKIIYYYGSRQPENANAVMHVNNAPFGDTNPVERDVNRDDYTYYSGDSREIMRNAYCKVWINRDLPVSKKEGCLAFTHEYGHLLGKNHIWNNAQSPMYQGFLWFDDIKRYRHYYWAYQHKQWAKNVCPSNSTKL